MPLTTSKLELMDTHSAAQINIWPQKGHQAIVQAQSASLLQKRPLEGYFELLILHRVTKGCNLVEHFGDDLLHSNVWMESLVIWACWVESSPQLVVRALCFTVKLSQQIVIFLSGATLHP